MATASSDSCNCLGHSCNNAIIQNFLGTNASITKTVTWSSCTTDPFANLYNCDVQYINITSQIKLCWHSCNSVTAQFIGLPPCIPCYPDNFCMVLTPSTSGGWDVLQGSSTLFDSVTIKLQISTDPDVVIQCSYVDANRVTVVYTCNGKF